MYCLISEDLRGLGGPMGTESTAINFEKYFNYLDNAKDYAQRDYKQRPIQWKRNKTTYSSGDLGFVMYTITRVETED